MDMVFPTERTHFFQVSIKLAQPFPAPELRTKNFTDTTRIFLKKLIPVVDFPAVPESAVKHC